VGTDTEEETKVDRPGTDVGTGLAVELGNDKSTVLVVLNELRVVDRTDTELTLDGRDKRGTLEESTSQGLHGALNSLLAALGLAVETSDDNVALT
jgi:hypothetical protein